MDVKKIGRIPDGGGWRAHGREMGSSYARKRRPIGYDFIHSVVDDYSRFAYSEILPDDAGQAAPRSSPVLSSSSTRPASASSTRGHHRQPLDTRSKDLATILEAHRIEHILIRPHCPWQNGKVERFNRTLQNEWAYRQVFASNDERATALAPWLDDYNTRRRHSALGGLPDQPPVTNLMAGYS